MKKWRVTLPTIDQDYGWNEINVIEADSFCLENNKMLYFYREGDKKPLALFNIGQWLKVEEQQKMPKELEDYINRVSLMKRIWKRIMKRKYSRIRGGG